MAPYGKGNRRLFKKDTIAFNQKSSELVKVQLNHKTWVYVKKDTTEKEIEKLRQKYTPSTWKI